MQICQLPALNIPILMPSPDQPSPVPTLLIPSGESWRFFTNIA